MKAKTPTKDNLISINRRKIGILGLQGFVWSYFLPIITLIVLYLKGNWFLLPWGLIFIGVTILDLLGFAGIDESSFKTLHRDHFKYLLWAYIPLHFIILFYGAWIFPQMTPIGKLGVILAVGLNAGVVSLVYAHELIHKTDEVSKFLGDVLLTSVAYLHYGIEHIRGHHVWVATYLDSSSARENESFYEFLPRALWGQLFDSWTLEKERLEKMGKSCWNLGNKFWLCLLLPVCFMVVFLAAYGLEGLFYFAGQAFVAVVLMQVVNYIQHYGLQRTQYPSGDFEPMGPQHSWEASSRINNLLLINLQRHNDHHLHTTKSYQNLRLLKDSPQLPGGYSIMAIAAIIPPLWKRLVHPRLYAFRRHQDF